MPQDAERREWIRTAMADAGLNALVCTLPENVLMLSGYWPVIGTAIAVATRDGRVSILVPMDERDLAEHGLADEARTYSPGSLSALTGPIEAVREPLAALLQELDLARGRIGYEGASVWQESSYSAMFLFQAGVREVLERAAPSAEPASGAAAIARLRSRLTKREVDRARLACRIAGEAFTTASKQVRAGLREPEVAATFATPMFVEGLATSGVERAGGFAWCMSGENSALAGAAYARTRNRELRQGDFVLIHANSYADGYWTDITRTYCLGAPDERKRAMYDAVFASRAAALETIRPGVAASQVDQAARSVLDERGFGKYFTHGLGHNVGFSAISGEFPPVLHPASADRLEVGMTFNVEPSIYIEGYGGLRHCDVVTLREDGPEVLTPLQVSVDELVVG